MRGNFVGFIGAWAYQTVFCHCSWTVGTQISLFYFADDALFDPLYGGSVAHARGYLGAELGGDPCFDGCFGQGPYFDHIVTHGFLTIYVFFETDGLYGDGEVIVVGYAYVDGINTCPFGFEQFPPISVGFCSRDKLSGAFEVFFVHVTQGDNFDVGVFFKLL